MHDPIITDTGQRIAGIRLGDRRAHALLQALLVFRLLPNGFLNRDLRDLLAGLLGKTPDQLSAGQITYDLHAPRGALLYPQRSWEELEGRFLGPMAYLDAKARGNSSLPEKQWLWSGV